jgi:hypothetical protein
MTKISRVPQQHDNANTRHIGFTWTAGSNR